MTAHKSTTVAVAKEMALLNMGSRHVLIRVAPHHVTSTDDLSD